MGACTVGPAWLLKLIGWKEGALRPKAWSLPGIPRWHLDDLPRPEVLTVFSLSPWEGSVRIPERSSESLPKKEGQLERPSQSPWASPHLMRAQDILSQRRGGRPRRWGVLRGRDQSEPDTGTYQRGTPRSRVWTSSRGQWGPAERSDWCFVKPPGCRVVWVGRGMSSSARAKMVGPECGWWRHRETEREERDGLGGGT